MPWQKRKVFRGGRRMPRWFLKEGVNRWQFYLEYHHKINWQVSQILGARPKLQQWNSIWFSVLTRQSSFSPLETPAPSFLPALFLHNDLHSLQGEPVIVVCACVFFFFSWCVAHVRNTIQVLLSFRMTWFPLWEFKTSRSRNVWVGCAPAVLCLKCHHVEPGVQSVGSAPNQRLVRDRFGGSQRSVLCTPIAAFTMEMWFHFAGYKPVFLYWMPRPYFHRAERAWDPMLQIVRLWFHHANLPHIL